MKFNGWGCRCWVRQITKCETERGWKQMLSIIKKKRNDFRKSAREVGRMLDELGIK